jgi:signal peptidase I
MKGWWNVEQRLNGAFPKLQAGGSGSGLDRGKRASRRVFRNVFQNRPGRKGDDSRAVAKAIIAAFIAALLLKSFVFDFMLVEGSSMEPALMPGQVVMVNRLAYGIRSPFLAGRGNRYLVRWKMPEENDVVVFWTPLGALAVKRIYALVPGERFIALGDNALQSYDSRAYGPAPLDNIVGKVIQGK